MIAAPDQEPGKLPETSRIPPEFPTVLNDRDRNQAYDKAIAEAIAAFIATESRPPKVLDLGAGSALLSVIALHHGAAHVTALEANREFAELAAKELADRFPVEEDQEENALWDVAIGMSLDFKLGPNEAPYDMIVSDLNSDTLNGRSLYLYVWCVTDA